MTSKPLFNPHHGSSFVVGFHLTVSSIHKGFHTRSKFFNHNLLSHYFSLRILLERQSFNLTCQPLLICTRNLLHCIKTLLLISTWNNGVIDNMGMVHNIFKKKSVLLGLLPTHSPSHQMIPLGERHVVYMFFQKPKNYSSS